MTEIQENREGIFGDDIEPPEADLIKIFIATDTHLGYNEDDPIRGNDSFEAFEEVLKHAVENEVDMILLGGDLFHDSKPSPRCYHRCISLLKRYCMGDRPVSLEFLSDQSLNFAHLKNPIVNYEDPNLNISIPVFSIHGNHDDPTGLENLSSMDILSDTGLVNYFGKWTDLTKIEIYPLLMQKGVTKLALYGLSHIKDERLSRLFMDKKVSMVRPMNQQEWFNIFVLHQNRAQNRGVKNYIPETVLPNFFNLVLWGHEHDCLIDPVSNLGGPFIIQPGSSVATSLAKGEALPKHVAIIHVYGTKFRCQKIKLNTVRPFVYRETLIVRPNSIHMASNKSTKEYVQQQIKETVEEMMNETKAVTAPENKKLPLLRLNVIFMEAALMNLNAIRMGQQFADRVANPMDMFSFKLRRVANITSRQPNIDVEDIEENQLGERIEHLVDTYFTSRNETLSVLSTKGLSEAVTRFIDQKDTDALQQIYNHQLNKTLEKLMAVEGDIDEYRLDELLEDFRKERENHQDEEMAEINEALNSEKRSQQSVGIVSIDLSSDDEVPVEDDGKAKGSKTNSKKSLDLTSSDVFSPGSDISMGRPVRGRGSRGPRRARGRGRSAAK